MNVHTAVRSDKAERLARAREEAYATPLRDFHPGAPRLLPDDTLWPWFERLRRDARARPAGPREEAYAPPLRDFPPGAPRLFQDDTLWPWFERLRKEEPVHYCTNAPIEPYWSVTKYNDIMTVDTSHGIYSSDAARGGINIKDAPRSE